MTDTIDLRTQVVRGGPMSGVLRDKGGAVFNVIHPDFAAMGDGTTDDQAAIQLAINAAQATNGVLVFPPSATTYRVRSKLSITAPLTMLLHGATLLFDFPVATSTANGALIDILSSRVRILGGTIDATGLTGTITGANRYAIRCEPAGATRYSEIEIKGVRFTNLTQYSGTLPGTTTVMHAIYLKQVDRPRISGCYVDTISGAGVFLVDTSKAKVFNNDLLRFGWSGVWMNNANVDWSITNNRFSGTTQAAPSYWGGAIDIMGQTSDGNLPGLVDQRGYIGFNQFNGGVYRYGQVVRLSSSQGVIVEGNLFDQCDAENNQPGTAPPGIAPGGGGAGSHNNLIQCTVRDVTLNNGPWRNITIRGNIFRAIGAGYQKAIYAVTTSGTNTNTTACEGLIVHDNQFVCPDASNYFGSDVYVHGAAAGAKDISIRGNIFKAVPLANSNYTPLGGCVVIATNATKTISGVQIKGNLFEYFNGAGTTNNHSGVNLGNDVSADVEGNNFKNFFRSITIDAAAGKVPTLPNTHALAASGSAYNDRGQVLTPSLGGYHKRVTANETCTSSTTLQSPGDLKFPIGPNEEWVAEFTLDVGSGLATTGIKLAITTPAGATLDVGAALTADVVTAANAGYKRTTVSGTAMDFTAATQVGVASAQVRVRVWVLNGATAGNIQLQFAQSTSSATALVILKGSEFRAERLA